MMFDRSSRTPRAWFSLFQAAGRDQPSAPESPEAVLPGATGEGRPQGEVRQARHGARRQDVASRPTRARARKGHDAEAEQRQQTVRQGPS